MQSQLLHKGDVGVVIGSSWSTSVEWEENEEANLKI